MATVKSWFPPRMSNCRMVGLRAWHCFFCLLLLLLLPIGAKADSLQRFAQFLGATHSGRANFEQKIVDRQAKVVQESRGTFAFQRPGRFRWSYTKPYAQLIVGDGAKVWVYDEDLQQVTVRRADRALGSTPAALLSGNNEVIRAFKLDDRGMKDGLEWMDAKPRDLDSTFERISLGFGFSGLEILELRDTFGQITTVRFTSFEINPRLDAGVFRFVPPKGVDIVGDGK
jgi:outer membrane lipoprotein carrier protein